MKYFLFSPAPNSALPEIYKINVFGLILKLTFDVYYFNNFKRIIVSNIYTYSSLVRNPTSLEIAASHSGLILNINI